MLQFHVLSWNRHDKEDGKCVLVNKIKKQNICHHQTNSIPNRVKFDYPNTHVLDRHIPGLVHALQ